MNPWLIAVCALLLGFIPCGVVCMRARTMDALAAVELAGVLTVLLVVLLAEGMDRPIFYDLALGLAVLSFPSGLVFIHFLERWL